MSAHRRLRKILTGVAAAATAAVVLGACGSARPASAPGAKTPPASSRVSRPAPSATPLPITQKPHPVDCQKTQCVALTFDAGPGPDTTRLLDILKAKGVNATFFLLGKNVTRRPDLVRREASEGHELANHTWTHRLLTKASAEETRHELMLLQERVKELTGRTPTLMRPPRGLTNPSVAEVCRSLGLAQILWSVTAKDYRDHDPEVITSRVLQGAQRNGIILLHDVYPGTVPAVPGIIDGLRRRGLTPVTVSQLFAPHRPEPGQAYWSAPSA
ncbi:polysaccharide deacetylase family protein [Streptomyces sp. NBC_01296]|uniref:polysaccharide deacetylase family protein n=1 Tax=Streptomyces sp. NBC_01296 TaxID=2903816 RepID=UPI002E154DEE|nr:polysaccharide deacetylase family protein [Streptomyces sp. NBC_01296]WSN53435.1 polysaccharide deacetylase family protein [Streptomyces sp. NBC_01296]